MRSRRELLDLEQDIERRPLLEDVTRNRPRLRIVREVDNGPEAWWDSPVFGAAVVMVTLGLTVAICVFMGWLRP